MIMISFKTRKDKERMLRKAKEMAEYVEDWIDCIEEARHGEHYEDDEDYEYSERNPKSMNMRMRSRYGYSK